MPGSTCTPSAVLSRSGVGDGDEVRLGTVSTGAGQRVFLAEGTQELIADLTPGGRRVVPCHGAVLVIR